ncbi:MAG TPA: ABC transporter ATP-binding protein [Candidatus Limnocylindrales bacterium]|nr:ABC transporter ATP-binding protein [Candidatus Limnocylindrales bacterium]
MSTLVDRPIATTTPPDATSPAPADAIPAIELVDVTKRYGRQVALDHVSIRIEAGEFFCLLGPSGCGKTTTLNLIGGFLPLTEGELRIEGRRVNDLPPHRRNVNTVFQNYALFPHLSVIDNVGFGLRMEKLPGDEIRRRAGEYLDLVGLADFSDRFPAQLSGGQQQRVALARALAKRPAVLLLDEPLGALDLKLRKQMQVELGRIHRQVGTTFVFVTHDQGEALSMATRIAVMTGGRVAQVGAPRDVYYRPVDRFVADFIGESNVLEGRLAGVRGGVAEVVLGDGSTVGATLATVTDEADVAVMVRPEAIHPGGDRPADASTVRGRVIDVSFVGDQTRLTIRTPVGDLIAARPHANRAAAGALERLLNEEVDAWWSAADAAVISR